MMRSEAPMWFMVAASGVIGVAALAVLGVVVWAIVKVVTFFTS